MFALDAIFVQVLLFVFQSDGIACTNLDVSSTDVLGDEVRRDNHVCYNVGVEDEILLDHSFIGAVNVLDKVAVGRDCQLNANNGL